MAHDTMRWTNPSVLAFASSGNPIDKITSLARQTAFNAIESGWRGPPYDPFELARLRNLQVMPREDVSDARIVPADGRRLRIEFNPNRPPWRVRFSIAHEVAHTLFPDCAESVRHRSRTGELRSDHWQLELLCNLAAAELLMPLGTFREIAEQPPRIKVLIDARKTYDVSPEALLLRFVKVTNQPCAVFAAARYREDDDARYRLDYVIPSKHWEFGAVPGLLIDAASKLAECTGVGYTTSADEKWAPHLPAVHVECVGIPPYPGSRHPRVVGLVSPTGAPRATRQTRLAFVYGSALEPRGSGYRIVTQVVNDRTSNWGGGGFAVALRKKWPVAQNDFQDWARQSSENLELGRIHLTEVAPKLAVASLVAQHGFGPSSTPRIRYHALQESLSQLGTVAMERSASIHMPRIGCGQAGGDWSVVEELISDEVCARGINVTVYDLPS